MELVLAALLVLAVLGFVAHPLLKPRRALDVLDLDSETAESLADRRQAIYREILELEFDHRIGKLSESDFRELSEVSLVRAAGLLAEAERRDLALDAQVERQIAVVRARLTESNGRAAAPPTIP